MVERPLLIFPNPTNVSREAREPAFPRTAMPTRDRQVERIDPVFQRLENAFGNRRGILRNTMNGIIPEQALVFETVNSIEKFINAVRRIEGLEWLAEWERDFEPDDDFHDVRDGQRTDRPIGGRLFLIMSDHRALSELRSLWEIYKRGEGLPHNKKKWRQLFEQLKDIRLWNIADRFNGTGIEVDWEERVQAGQESIRFEIELWFRNSEEKRRETVNYLNSLVQQANGHIITQYVNSEICYHALLVESPISIFNDLSQNTNIELLVSDFVMFFRPQGQSLLSFTDEAPEMHHHPLTTQPTRTHNSPITAILDGMPVANHDHLINRIIIDDPDNYDELYQSHERIHGTTMASLIIHGELDKNEIPLLRPVYIRPILQPDPQDFNDPRTETMPRDSLAIDLVHRAVRRIFEGDGEEPAAAPNVKIINLSIGDGLRPFDFSMSPWAKLLDWLSYKYKVLFIVSAGNFKNDIRLDLTADQLANMTDDELSDTVVAAIHRDSQHRRILTPSESINAITVGALHDDSSTVTYLGGRKDLLRVNPMISPATRVGFGYRKAIKPDIVMSGGRQLYNDFHEPTYSVSPGLRAPGHKVAYPGRQGELNYVAYTRGTSNANALATRTASIIYEQIEELRTTQENGNQISERDIAVLLKALLIHGASWGEIFSTLVRAFPGVDRIRERIIPRLIGYGMVEPSRVYECTEQRATLFGCNLLGKDMAHVYSVPLPPSLSSRREWRRLTITLAWFTPVNSNSQKYRQAHLWFDPPNEVLALTRRNADYYAVKRGTVQHEVLEGDGAVPFLDGDNLVIKINCREDAGGLNVPIPYGLAVTLEVAEGIQLPIYNEIRDRIRPRVHINPNVNI